MEWIAIILFIAGLVLLPSFRKVMAVVFSVVLFIWFWFTLKVMEPDKDFSFPWWLWTLIVLGFLLIGLRIYAYLEDEKSEREYQAYLKQKEIEREKGLC